MRRSPFERIAAWLCLVLTFATATVPAQSFVLCIEPDGRMSLEAADARGMCGGCEVPSEDSRACASPAVDPACPCVDVTLAISVQDTRVQPRRAELPDAGRIGLPVASFENGLLSRFPSLASLAAHAPRPPDSLALIRSIVLRV